MARPRSITQPEKELRFTRAGQARVFVLLAALGMAMILGSGMLAWVPHDGLIPPHVWQWVGIIFALLWTAVAIWAVAYCVTHAYILLTPLGVEVFSFFYPTKYYRLIPWADIETLRLDEAMKWVAFDQHGGGGVYLSLAPLLPRQRELLREALQRRLGKPEGNGQAVTG